MPAQTVQVLQSSAWLSLVLQAFPPRFWYLEYAIKHAPIAHCFSNQFSTVNMISLKYTSINPINLFVQNYTRSLPTLCVAWNFTAGMVTACCSGCIQSVDWTTGLLDSPKIPWNALFSEKLNLLTQPISSLKLLPSLLRHHLLDFRGQRSRAYLISELRDNNHGSYT